MSTGKNDQERNGSHPSIVPTQASPANVNSGEQKRTNTPKGIKFSEFDHAYKSIKSKSNGAFRDEVYIAGGSFVYAHAEENSMSENDKLDGSDLKSQEEMNDAKQGGVNLHGEPLSENLSFQDGRITEAIDPIYTSRPIESEHEWFGSTKSSTTDGASLPPHNSAALHHGRFPRYGDSGGNSGGNGSANCSSASSRFHTSIRQPLGDPSSSSSGFNLAVVRGYSEETEEANGDLNAASGISPDLGPRDGAAGRNDFRFPESSNDFQFTQSSNHTLFPESSSEAKPAFPTNGSASQHHLLHASPGRAPEIPLPEVPRRNSARIRTPVPKVSDEEWEYMNRQSPDKYNSEDSANLLAGASYGGSRLYQQHDHIGFAPVPLRTKTNKDKQIGDSVISQGAASGTGLSSRVMSTDSEDDDPFRYDRAEYTQKPSIFLQPSREREVSSALRHLSHTSTTCSKATTQDSPERFVAQSAAPPVPRIPDEMIASGQEYHSRFEYGNRNAAEDENAHGDASFLDAEQGGHADVSGDGDTGDWETVITSGDRFGSTRAVYSSTVMDENGSFRPAGSSLGSYSEAYPVPLTFDPLDSSERVLQHPGEESQGGRDIHLNLRMTTDAGQPVLLPSQNERRPNGFPLDSGRMVPQASAFGGRNGPSSRVHGGAGNMRHGVQGHYKNLETGKKKYEFRDSMLPDQHDHDYKQSPYAANNMDVGRERNESGSTSMGVEKPGQFAFGLIPLDEAAHRQVEAAKHEHRAATNMGASRHRDGSGSSSRVAETPTQFSFELIPLNEAVQRQSVARSHGEDPTSTGSAKGHSKLTGSRSNRTNSTRKTSPSTSTKGPRFPSKAKLSRSRVDAIPLEHMTGTTAGKTPRKSATTNTGFWMAAPRMVPNDDDYFRVTPMYSVQLSACPVPHLLPREHRRAHSVLSRRRSARDLQESHIGHEEVIDPFGVMSEDANITRMARGRRTLLFYIVAFLCIVPFFPPLVLLNKLNTSISWLTNGEVGAWNRRQGRVLRILSIVSLFIWLSAVVALLILVSTVRRGVRRG